MEEVKSKSRKRKDLSEMAARNGRLRLNGNGAFKGPFSAPVKDLRVHRIFSPVSTGDLDEVDDCTVAGKVFGSGVVGSLGQNGVFDQSEVVQECNQTTPPEEVLAKSKIVDASNKAYVSPGVGSGGQVVGRRSPGSKKIKPSSRTKLFGNPSSFSYRRLLPYLMDITKGALKSLEMKPQLLTNATNSVVESCLSKLEPKVSDGTNLTPLNQGLSLSKISEPNICTENTADTTVPLNSCLADQEVSVSSINCDLSDGQTGVLVNKNDELSQSEAGKVTEVICSMDVLCGMVGCGTGIDALDTVSSEAMNDPDSVDSATQLALDESRSDLMDVLEDALLCRSRDLGDVPAVKMNDVKYDLSSKICGKNSTEVVQETPLDDKVYGSKDVLGIAGCALKPVSPNKTILDHEQIGSEANSTFLVEAISGSSSVESAAQLSHDGNRGGLTIVLGDALSYEHLHLSDAHEAKDNDVKVDKPQTTICSQRNAELVHITPVVYEDTGRKDVTETVKSISKRENNLDDSVITKAKNSVGEQFNGITDSKQSPSSERKLHLKPRRLKRFMNYNSVSYRKLLPYLTEIYEDSAGSSNKGQVKIDVAPAIVGDSIEKGHPTSASCNVESQMTNFDCVSEQDTVAESESAIESHLENGLNSLNDLQFSSHVQDQPAQGPQPSCGPHDMHIDQSVEESQCTASNFKEEDMTKIKKHSDDSNLSNFVPVYPEPISPHRRPFASSTRGILKKNPKGCRGLCTCLKCALFRLHAEKAFEFSRNQLLDSEEIALELINELSLLRNLLKKSVDADKGETSQVQEAYNKAHAVEQHAKARFEQMNHDLQIHCQIPNLHKPSVSFARHTEENIIRTTHSPS